METKYLLVLFFAFLTASPIAAQTQMEMNREAHAAYEKADAELNRIYKQLAALLDKKEKQLLVKAQKSWIQFRDTHCQFEIVTYEGGSIQPLIFSNCMTECTNTRTEDLKNSIKDRQR